ncbi:MAG: initiation factor 2B [Desulfurococcaceae archaeon]
MELTSTEYVLSTLKNFLKTSSEEEFLEHYLYTVDKVLSNRPSNYGCINALKALGTYILENPGFSLEDVFKIVNELINVIDNACTQSAIIASNRINNEDVLMTNSRSLCLQRMFRALIDRGINVKVYVLESRPGMEGLETAKWLDDNGLETYLIIDSATRFFIKNVDKVIVGAEAVAANGAVISKVGTSLLSLIANEARVRVLVVSPMYKFSYETVFGETFKIVEGDWKYLMNSEVRRNLPENYNVYVPLFDITPPEYIDALVTEYGLFSPQALAVIAKQTYWFKYGASNLEEIVGKIKKKFFNR